jgi:hypothetical protein
MTGGNLLSRITNATPIDIDAITPINVNALDTDGTTHTAFAQTHIVDYVGFPALLPVLYHEKKVLWAVPGSGCTDINGNIDFMANN